MIPISDQRERERVKTGFCLGIMLKGTESKVNQEGLKT